MEHKTYLQNPAVVSVIAIVCTCLWGSAFPAVKTGYAWFAVAAEDVFGKLLFAGVRFFGAGILTLLAAVIFHRCLMLPGKKYLPAIGALGLIQTFLQYVFFYIALANMTGSKGSVVNAMGTFISVIIAHFLFTDDRLNRYRIIGCVFGIAGIIIINMKGGIAGAFTLKGDGIMLLAALAFAFGNILSKKMSGGLDAMWLTGYQLSFGGALLILSGLIGGGRLNVISSKGILLMFYMSFLSAAAFTLWLMLLKNNPVGRISIYSSLVPVFGTLLSGIFLKENIFTAVNVAALLCVVCGIYLVNRKTG